MANKLIREICKERKVRMWELADALQIHENTLSRKLRKELPAEEKARIMSIILQISGEEAKANE